jgi:peptidoglycan/LPS O-acetylase OafA/YrhL
VLVMPVLVFVGATIRVGHKWRRPSLILGEFSYPLYILHLPLLAPLYLAQKLDLHGTFYQVLAPLSVCVLAFITRWIAIHYDSPVRKYLTQKAAILRRHNRSGGGISGAAD